MFVCVFVCVCVIYVLYVLYICYIYVIWVCVCIYTSCTSYFLRILMSYSPLNKCKT